MLVCLTLLIAVLGDYCDFEAAYPPQYVAYYTDTPPNIDGRVNDPIWEEVGWTDAFIDIEGPPPIQPLPRFHTSAKLRWDSHWLYIATYMVEPHVWANLTEHNSVIFHDNDFEVFVNPDGTSHFYKEFEVNAFNTTWSLCLNKPYLNGGYENSTRVFPETGWDDPRLKSGVFIDGTINDPSDIDKGWSVEIALPLDAMALNNSVSLPPKAGDYWRINFSRVEWHVKVVNGKYVKVNQTEDNWVWAPTGVINIHLPETWSYVQFAKGVVNETRLVKDPHWTIRYVAMQVYYSQVAYKELSGKYTDDLNVLIPLAPAGPRSIDGTCTLIPRIRLSADGGHYEAEIPSNHNFNSVAIIRDDRYLVVVTEAPWKQD